VGIADAVLGRRRAGARFETIGAARMKGAAGWKGSEDRDCTLDGPKPVTAFGARQRSEQAARIGMLRRAKNRPHRPVFDDSSRVHDRHAIGSFRHYTQIVGYQ
jgi:hypothetical protein